MPSAKRERQRANRAVKQAIEQKVANRRKLRKRAISITALAAVVVLVAFWVQSGSSKKTPPPVTAPGAAQRFAATSAGETTSKNCPSLVNIRANLTKPTFPAPPPMTINPARHYYATVNTDVGSFVISLDAAKAPNTVNNFVFLAEHHYYDCVIFHRVIQGFMDQTGDPTGTGKGGPGYKFADELPAKVNPPNPQYPLGSVAMANSGPNTNGSQFFIVTGSAGEQLPPSYSLFGTVTAGMPVVQKINGDGGASSDPNGSPKVTHRINSVTISVA